MIDPDVFGARRLGSGLSWTGRSGGGHVASGSLVVSCAHPAGLSQYAEYFRPFNTVSYQTVTKRA